MSTSPTTGSRRWRFALMTTVLLLAVGASTVIANLLAQKFAHRIDVTETGEHHLAPQTSKLLDSLDKPYRVVIAADFRQIDPRARERVADILEKFSRRSTNVRSVLLDTASPEGVSNYDTLLRDLIQRDAAPINASLESMRKASAEMTAIAAELNTKAIPTMGYLRDRFEPIAKADKTTGQADAKPAKTGTYEALQQRIAALQALAKDLTESAKATTEPLAWDPNSGRPPEIAAPQHRLSEAVSAGKKLLTTLAGELSAFSKADTLAADARGLAGAALRGIEKLRDRAAVVTDDLARLPKLDIVRLADALKAPAAVLIVGPEGIAAIDPVSLFPPGELLDAGGAPLADMRRKGEDLLATAISSLRNPIKPIVVLMHGESNEFLDRAPLLDRARQRLALRGIDMLEWATAVNPPAPDISQLDPKGVRPVIYAVFSPAAWTASDNGGTSGAERAAKLAGALDAIAESGRPILLSLNPSPMPSYGQKDPIASVLERFSLIADSGRPILKESITPKGRIAETDLTVLGSRGDHPISQALGKLPVLLPWSVGIAPLPGSTPTWSPICQVQADASTWAESNWLGLRKTRREDRPLVPDQPVFDKDKDSNTGPWTVVAAAERKFGDNSTQRLLVVGSNDWFIDPVLSATTTVDGREVSLFPGNVELLESGVYWLAGQDDLIARSPAAQSAPIVQPLEHRAIVMLRVAFLAGIPLLILGLGLIYRAMFG